LGLVKQGDLVTRELKKKGKKLQPQQGQGVVLRRKRNVKDGPLSRRCKTRGWGERLKKQKRDAEKDV